MLPSTCSVEIRWLTLIIQAGLSSLTLGLIVFQSAITYSKPLKNQDGTARRTVPALSLRSACTLSVQTIRPLNINQLSVHRMCPYCRASWVVSVRGCTTPFFFNPAYAWPFRDSIRKRKLSTHSLLINLELDYYLPNWRSWLILLVKLIKFSIYIHSLLTKNNRPRFIFK